MNMSKLIVASIILFVVLAIIGLLFVFVLVPFWNKGAEESNFNVIWDKGKVSVSGAVKYKYDQKQGKSVVEATGRTVSGDLVVVSSDAVGTVKADSDQHGSVRLKDQNTIIVHLDKLPPQTGFGFAFDKPPKELVVTDSKGNRIPVSIIGQDEVTTGFDFAN